MASKRADRVGEAAAVALDHAGAGGGGTRILDGVKSWSGAVVAVFLAGVSVATVILSKADAAKLESANLQVAKIVTLLETTTKNLDTFQADLKSVNERLSTTNLAVERLKTLAETHTHKR